MHPTTLLTPRSRYVPPTKCRLFDPAYRACAAVTRRSISSCDRHGTAGRVTVPPPLRSRISATSEFPATSAFQQRIDFPAAGPILASTQDGGRLWKLRRFGRSGDRCFSIHGSRGFAGAQARQSARRRPASGAPARRLIPNRSTIPDRGIPSKSLLSSTQPIRLAAGVTPRTKADDRCRVRSQ